VSSINNRAKARSSHSKNRGRQSGGDLGMEKGGKKERVRGLRRDINNCDSCVDMED